jgi:lipid-binding SYLF domain-containing protein
MKVLHLFTTGVLMLALAAGNAFAQTEKVKKQTEVRKVTQTTLEKFYKANPKLKEQVTKAPGYAVFTTYGLSFLIGGAGGSGLAQDNKTKKTTYMDMAQVSAGVQIGAAQTETLIIFKTPKAMEQFVNSGWEFGGGGGAQVGAGGASAGPGAGENVIADASYYTLTPNGLQAGGAAAGTKFWKSKDLN